MQEFIQPEMFCCVQCSPTHKLAFLAIMELVRTWEDFFVFVRAGNWIVEVFQGKLFQMNVEDVHQQISFRLPLFEILFAKTARKGPVIRLQAISEAFQKAFIITK